MNIKYNNRHNNHIQGLFFKTASLLLRGCKPVYVFDGPPPVLKSGVIAERKELRDAGKSHRVPKDAFTECEQLAVLMGVQVVHAPSEAEAQAAALTRACANSVAVTDDIDVLPFGARCMVKSGTRAKTVISVEIADVLRELDLTMPQFVDLCVLLGSDYTPKTGFGPVTAFNLIKKYGSIEDIIAAGTPVNFEYVDARKEFMTPHVDVIEPTEPKKLTAGEFEKLSAWLRERVDATRIAKTLTQLKKMYGL